MKMHLSGWGNFPVVLAKQQQPRTQGEIGKLLHNFQGIARGMGRSYGDSALADSVMCLLQLNQLLDFDRTRGILSCAAGVTIADILSVIVPQGWFMPVTPGTQYVTIGGAIASDVHGKNHHQEGSFCVHLIDLSLMLANGDVVICSSQQNAELFHATCGGMGLTGIILSARIRLKSISSAWIQQQVIATGDLAETLAAFDTYESSTYSVAWIDCLVKGSALGRSIIMLGEHMAATEVQAMNLPITSGVKFKLTAPFAMPSSLLHPWALGRFNAFYYRRMKQSKRTLTQIPYEPFFYPLDRILQWNRLYGKRGFLQYQCVLPKESGKVGMMELLQYITASQRGSFLAVLKSFGVSNQNLLSFPRDGYTLALDFKYNSSLLPLLDKLDAVVSEYGGRVYLTKDARMSKETFREGYPDWEKFVSVRQKYGAVERFNSLQSQRLGI